jgi:hypothetical protein
MGGRPRGRAIAIKSGSVYFQLNAPATGRTLAAQHVYLDDFRLTAGALDFEQHGQFITVAPALDAAAGSFGTVELDHTKLHLYHSRGDVQKRLSVGHLVRRSHQLLGTSFS